MQGGREVLVLVLMSVYIRFKCAFVLCCILFFLPSFLNENAFSRQHYPNCVFLSYIIYYTLNKTYFFLYFCDSLLYFWSFFYSVAVYVDWCHPASLWNHWSLFFSKKKQRSFFSLFCFFFANLFSMSSQSLHLPYVVGPSSPLTIPTVVVMSTDLIIALVLWDGMQSFMYRK